MESYDYIVAGLGTVGAATVMSLARRGMRVLGLDLYKPPHLYGSHHGESRSIRRAYLEGTGYVSMAIAAWDGWRELEKDTGTSLLLPTGNLTIGPANSPAVAGFIKSARSYNIPYEELSATEVNNRWPQLSPADGFIAGLEVEAGILKPEKAIATMLAEAERAGAILHFNEPLRSWQEKGDYLQLESANSRYIAGRLLLATGAFSKPLLGTWGNLLQPMRVPVHWLAPPNSADFALGKFPVNFWQLPGSAPGETEEYHEFYSLPALSAEDWVKAAPHNHLSVGDPLLAERGVDSHEQQEIRNILSRCIPALAGGKIRSSSCYYNMTKDGDFILGPLPDHDNVFIAALAGHGFKFAPLLGEILADLMCGIEPGFEMQPFLPERFTLA